MRVVGRLAGRHAGERHGNKDPFSPGFEGKSPEMPKQVVALFARIRYANNNGMFLAAGSA
jgi:hypothetical protein